MSAQESVREQNSDLEPEYELAATFVFECKDTIGKAKYLVHKEATNEIYIYIERKLRRDPIVGMKQPTPHGAMLGWEGALEVQHKGKIAPGYQWKLYRSKVLVQEGRTNEKGEDSLELDLPGISQPEYTLEVFAPVINEEDESGNKSPEESDEPSSQSNQRTSVRSSEPDV